MYTWMVIDEIVHTEVFAATNLFFGQVQEPDLDEIEPRGTGRNKVEMKARMPLQPRQNPWMFVRHGMCVQFLNGRDAL